MVEKSGAGHDEDEYLIKTTELRDTHSEGKVRMNLVSKLEFVPKSLLR